MYFSSGYEQYEVGMLYFEAMATVAFLALLMAGSFAIGVVCAKLLKRL